jgi:hypothetical protein
VSVHVNEVQTRVVPTGAPATGSPPEPDKSPHPGAAEEAWAAAAKNARRLELRTAARDFDD